MKRREPTVRASRRNLRGGVYLLPSLLTIVNMLLGFYALVLGLRGQFQIAVLLVFAAGVVDGLDGRLARRLGGDSEFGKQYDSLADMMTFGMVPALLAYFWGLSELGRIGWLVPFFYVVCGATRLARYNVQSGTVDRRYFVGLPIPAAAGLIGSLLFYAPDSDFKRWSSVVLLFVFAAMGGLMMSTFRYYSFKELDTRRRMSYRAILPVLLVVVILAWDPPAFFLAVSSSYALSGPTQWLLGRVRKRGAVDDAKAAAEAKEARSGSGESAP